MHLTSLSIPVRDLTFADYFQTVLGLRVESTGSATAQVRLGTTTLKLRVEPSIGAGIQHLAFTIPTGKFGSAKSWLIDRVKLIADVSGQDQFEGPARWNSLSVYFEGPDKSVLELIERRDLPNTREGPFSPADLLCVSEVGVAVPDVRATAGALKEKAGIEWYGSAPSDTFAAVGDANGLLILVPTGRAWWPTTDRRARACQIVVEATGHSGRHNLGSSVLVQHLPSARQVAQSDLSG